VELYLATVEQPELPTWLEELRSSAEITQLDPSESRALLNQLAAANQSHDKQQGVDADNRTGNRSLPSEAAEAILDEQPAGEGSQARRARVEEMAGLNVAYLGIEKSTAIASVIERANVRQQNSLNSANEPKAAGGLALGGGGKAGDAAAGLEAKNELAKRDESTQVEDSRQAWLQSNRLQLREQANRPGLEKESSGIQLQRANRQLGLGGRQIIIVIPPR
jgi:hypothetical protein